MHADVGAALPGRPPNAAASCSCAPAGRRSGLPHAVPVAIRAPRRLLPRGNCRGSAQGAAVCASPRSPPSTWDVGGWDVGPDRRVRSVEVPRGLGPTRHGRTSSSRRTPPSDPTRRSRAGTLTVAPSTPKGERAASPESTSRAGGEAHRCAAACRSTASRRWPMLAFSSRRITTRKSGRPSSCSATTCSPVWSPRLGGACRSTRRGC